jgi:hypothetical protein
MEASLSKRAEEIVGYLFMILITAANLIFFSFFHKYIAWYTTEPNGDTTRISLLTGDYFIWLPIVITASIVAIVAYSIFVFYDNYRFRSTVEMIISIIGIFVAGSLVFIFPFDFSVIPNATAATVVPIVVRAFFIILAAFYLITAVVQFIKLRNHTALKKGGGSRSS